MITSQSNTLVCTSFYLTKPLNEVEGGGTLNPVTAWAHLNGHTVSLLHVLVSVRCWPTYLTAMIISGKNIHVWWNFQKLLLFIRKFHPPSSGWVISVCTHIKWYSVFAETEFRHTIVPRGWICCHKLCLLQINNTDIKSIHYFMQ
jgi:hypothetical protein